MKKLFIYLKCTALFCCILFLANKGQAQRAFKKTIPISQLTPLPLKTYTSISWNGIISSQNFSRLKISAYDTLYFDTQDQRDFAKSVFSTLHINSIYKVAMLPNVFGPTAANAPGFNGFVNYNGKTFCYYYYCNTSASTIYPSSGLISRANTKFTVGYDSRYSEYIVVRNPGNSQVIETYYKYQPMAANLALDFNSFKGASYYEGGQMINDGWFFFFIH